MQLIILQKLATKRNDTGRVYTKFVNKCIIIMKYTFINTAGLLRTHTFKHMFYYEK